MRERWRAWKAKQWDEEWVGGWKIPPLRRAAKSLRRAVTSPVVLGWAGVLVAVLGFIRCS